MYVDRPHRGGPGRCGPPLPRRAGARRRFSRWPGTLEAVAVRHAELRRRGRRGVRTLDAILDERLGRGRYTDSEFETKTLRLLRSIGLPDPSLQHTVRDGDFVAHLDMAWPPVRWALECDSLAHHTGKRAHEWDRQRRRRLKQLGWDVVEVTYDDVTVRGAATGRELASLYRARCRTVLSALTRYENGER